ncbi:MAG: hypothetical protein BGP21_10715 [Thiobacillus sp. 65-29]|nr:MAG: hypothetical protein BGP21_10715 [Thiobacillus sp. 65-29]
MNAAFLGHFAAHVVRCLACEKVRAPQWRRIGWRLSKVALLRPDPRIELVQRLGQHARASHQAMRITDGPIPPGSRLVTVEPRMQRIKHPRLSGRVYPSEG